MSWVAAIAVALLLGAFALYLLGRWRAMSRHGRFELPCDEVVELPAGEHLVSYEDATRWRYSEPPEVWRGFSITVRDAESGEPIDLQEPPSPTPTKAPGRNRIPIGMLPAPRDGSYRITVRIDPGANKPHLIVS